MHLSDRLFEHLYGVCIVLFILPFAVLTILLFLPLLYLRARHSAGGT